MHETILIIGRDNGWNLESSYARAFTRLGFVVRFWDPEQSLHRVARGFRVGRLFSTFVHVEPWLRKANLDLLKLATELKPKLLLVIATEGVRAGTLGQLRAHFPHMIVYCLFPDTPHNLVPDRIQCLPMFDRIFTVSPAWIDSFQRLGGRSVHYLPLAADLELHRPVENKRQQSASHDVAFVGNWRRERETILEQLVDFDLRIWGSHYWKRNLRPGSKLAAHWEGRALFGNEFAEACATNRILLNIIDGVGWPGPNMRTFEQAACRAFSLVTRTPSVIELFKEGENIECFDSVAEARDKIEFYLSNETSRQRIANEAHNFVVQHGHTYLDRARELLRRVSEDGTA
jgi:spore maturation protein CgeB